MYFAQGDFTCRRGKHIGATGLVELVASLVNHVVPIGTLMYFTQGYFTCRRGKHIGATGLIE